ncbi:hypothetical protein ABW19_dt0205127 [Dactylella cylindrospora]|nr:hypothetical protein ABW19_dt0205127 [Dactylella cylindrospora]
MPPIITPSSPTLPHNRHSNGARLFGAFPSIPASNQSSPQVDPIHQKRKYKFVMLDEEVACGNSNKELITFVYDLTLDEIEKIKVARSSALRCTLDLPPCGHRAVGHAERYLNNLEKGKWTLHEKMICYHRARNLGVFFVDVPDELTVALDKDSTVEERVDGNGDGGKLPAALRFYLIDTPYEYVANKAELLGGKASSLLTTILSFFSPKRWFKGFGSRGEGLINNAV